MGARGRLSCFFLLFYLIKPLAHSVTQRDISFLKDPSYGINTKWNELLTHDRGYSICSDQKGFVFIADQNENRVLCFNERGEFVYQFGQKGQGPGDLARQRGRCF